MHDEPHTRSIGRDDIAQGLRALGISRGDAVEVHSSLSSLGWVQGGADAVVDALMAVVGHEGTLVMSAYPVSKPLPLTDEEKALGINAIVRLYGEDYGGPTGMGVIADTFRLRPQVVLGKGFHRVCAWGRDAAAHSTGYAHLLTVDGYAFLLGVGIGTCSSMHQGEVVPLPPEIRAHFSVPEDIRARYGDDYYVSYGRTPRDPWQEVLAEADRRGLVIKRQIGQAACLLFRAREMVAIYENALRTNPWQIYGLAKR